MKLITLTIDDLNCALFFSIFLYHTYIHTRSHARTHKHTYIYIYIQDESTARVDKALGSA